MWQGFGDFQMIKKVEVVLFSLLLLLLLLLFLNIFFCYSFSNQYRAIGARCTHYGAPLVKGVLENGRVRCPWRMFIIEKRCAHFVFNFCFRFHADGACFNTKVIEKKEIESPIQNSSLLILFSFDVTLFIRRRATLKVKKKKKKNNNNNKNVPIATLMHA